MDDGKLVGTVAALIVPPPLVTVKVAPEAVPSPVIEAVMVAVCTPSPSRVIVLAVVRLMLMGVSGTLTEALRVGSVLLVAVTVAVVPTTGVGAVYVAGAPLAVVAGVIEPPPVTVQVTPAFAPSFVTVAMKAWVAPATMAAGLVGVRAIEICFNVIVAVFDFVGSALLVAVSVTEVALSTGVPGAV